MTDHENHNPHEGCEHPSGVCSATIVAAPWRMAASHQGIGTVLDPTPLMPFGQAIDTMLAYALQTVAEDGHRMVGKPRVVVRTRGEADADERLRQYGQLLLPVLGAHTWLIASVDRTCAPLEATC